MDNVELMVSIGFSPLRHLAAISNHRFKNDRFEKKYYGSLFTCRWTVIGS